MRDNLTEYSGDHSVLPNNLKRAEIEEILVGTLYFFDRGRNAWHSEWSINYFGHRAFALDLSTLKSRIETERSQGSQWVIYEIPALVFRAKKVAGLVANIYNRYPLSRYQDVEPYPRLLAQLDAFGSGSSWFWRFIGETDSCGPASRPFRVFKSVSHGGHYRLGWEPSRSHVKPNSRFVTQLGRKLSEALGCDFRPSVDRRVTAGS